MSRPLVWNVDPVFFHFGNVSVRYYGICFGLALVTGFLVWYRRVLRDGRSVAFGEDFLIFTVPSVIIGGRVGYCFFYAPRTYLAHPLQILAFWRGGLASHGVAIGLAVALWLFSRRHHVTWTLVGDYFAPGVALAVGWVRIGNFFNSEVLGRVTHVPWAIVFARHDNLPRHPAQLYDFMIGPITWLVLRYVERKEIRPLGSGLIAGTFLVVYFGIRIFVETYKDFYLEELRTFGPFRVIESWVGVPIHTGQMLSVIPVLFGVILIIRAMAMRREPVVDSPAPDSFSGAASLGL